MIVNSVSPDGRAEAGAVLADQAGAVLVADHQQVVGQGQVERVAVDLDELVLLGDPGQGARDRHHGAVAQVAVEEAMACGVGICMTCVMPVRDARGTTKMVRSCLEGPVFRGDRVRWDAFEDGLCRVPADAVGAPKEVR